MTDTDDEDDADLAVFTSVLREELAGEQPPDLVAAVLARASVAGEAASPTLATRTAPQRVRWFVAALLLLGAGVVGTLVVLARRADPVVPAASDDVLPGGPVDLAALQAHALTTTDLTARGLGGWSDELQRFVRWPRWPLDDILISNLRPTLDDDDRDAVHAALAGAQDGGPLADVVWTHELRLAGAPPTPGVELRLRLGGGHEPMVGFRTPTGARRLLTPGFPGVDLTRELVDLTQRTVAGLGLVVGSGGFAAVPTAAARLVLLDVPVAAAGALERFPRLARLDLVRAREWHGAAALALVPAGVTDLRLDADLLDADGWRMLGARSSLRALDLAPVVMDFVLGRPRGCAVPESRLGDREVAALAGLDGLRELVLPYGTCTPIGLGAIASLRALEDLVLVSGPRPMDLSPLQGAAKLQRLHLVGPVVPSTVPALAGVTTLRNLGLLVQQDLDPALLPALARLTNLRRIELAYVGMDHPPWLQSQLADLQAALPECTVNFDSW